MTYLPPIYTNFTCAATSDQLQNPRIIQLNMAPKKTTKTKGKKTVQPSMNQQKNYEIVTLCCHQCKKATEIVGNDGNGKMTFREYYCETCAGQLTIVNFIVKP